MAAIAPTSPSQGFAGKSNWNKMNAVEAQALCETFQSHIQGFQDLSFYFAIQDNKQNINHGDSMVRASALTNVDLVNHEHNQTKTCRQVCKQYAFMFFIACICFW